MKKKNCRKKIYIFRRAHKRRGRTGRKNKKLRNFLPGMWFSSNSQSSKLSIWILLLQIKFSSKIVSNFVISNFVNSNFVILNFSSRFLFFEKKMEKLISNVSSMQKRNFSSQSFLWNEVNSLMSNQILFLFKVKQCSNIKLSIHN